MGFIFRAIGKLLALIFGSLSWQAPPWLRPMTVWRRDHSATFNRSVLVLLLIGIAGGAAYFYYQTLPEPLRYVAAAESPRVTPVVNDELQPQPLIIRFNAVLSTDVLRAQYPEGAPDVAQLDLIGETVKNGVTMKPAVPGTWEWLDANTLRFQPKNDWAPNQDYTVDFAPSIFAPHVELTQPGAVFSTPSMTVKLKNFRFYQDPADKKIRKTVATLQFSHPVDAESLDEKLSVAMRESDAGVVTKPTLYGRKITFDKFHREAYIHSDPVSPGEQTSYMKLHVNEGVASSLGGDASAQTVDASVKIPSRETFFKVAASQAMIARNADDEPEQALVVNFTDYVKHSAVVDATHVWLLPTKENAYERWNSPREVTDAVLAKAEPVVLEAMESERDSSQSHSFLLNIPEGRDLYVQLERGLTSDGDFKMATRYDTVLRSPEYPKEVRVMAEGALVAKSGDKHLPLQTRGLETIRYTIGRLLPQDINHLVSQTAGDISSPQFINFQFNEDNLTERFSGLISLAQQHPKKASFASIDLNPYLAQSNDRLGLFLVKVEGWDRKKGYAIPGTVDQRLVLVTDLGLLVKDNVDTSHDVFVQSINDGLPVSNAQVALLGKNGLPILRGTTDELGHVRLAETEGFERERTPTVYLVRTETDVTFIPFSRAPRFLNYSRFDTGGLHSRYQRDDQLTAYLFTDRGIYRPGESGHIGAIVRRFDFEQPGRIPLAVQITDPQGNTLVDKKLTLDPSGFIELDFATDDVARTGTYQAAIYIIDRQKRRDLIGTTNFRVEEFQPDRMRIRTRLSSPKAKGWINTTDVNGLVALENLFGAPAQNRRIEAELTLSPSGFGFKEFADYTFIDPYLDPEKPPRTIREKLPMQRSDDKGNATFELPLAKFDQGTYRLTFAADGYESGDGRSVSAATGVLLTPADKLIGYKADGGLDYLKRDAKRSVEFLAVDPELNRVAYDELTLRLVERQQVSTLVQQRDGTYRFQSVLKRRPVSETPFAIAAEDAAEYQLPSDKPGDYELELVGNSGRVVSRLKFSVVGAANVAGELEKNAELSIKLDRKDYRAGDEIEIAITAPYHGAGLITIERDRVYAFQWFQSDTTRSVQRIRIPEQLEGNAYVNVAFVRAADSKEIFTSPLSYGVAPFSIDRAKRQLELTLDAPERVKPGETLTIGFSSSKPSRMVVFAVDEGILQVADYKNPEPLDHFLQKRALEVRTAQIVDLILPEFALLKSLSATGGDEAKRKRALGANLNPFARKADAPIAFWSGIIEADAERREQSFTIPDRFNGELRLIAVAVSDQGMGMQSDSTHVRGPFVLQPNVPLAVAPGDEFDVTVGVSNALEGSGPDAKVMIEAVGGDRLQILGDAKQEIPLGEGKESRVEYRVKALAALGDTELRFRASHAEADARITTTLSVRPAVPYRTSLDAGFAENGKVTVKLPRTLYKNLGENRATGSAQPIALADGLITYLQHYPHNCTEQIVSQTYPLLAYLDSADYQGDIASKHQRLQALISSLRSRQSADGGFGLWPGDSRTATFPSIYVAQFLTDAAERGVGVPRDMLERLTSYLRGYAGDKPLTLNDARLIARAQYVLTRNGIVTTNMLVNLHETLNKKFAGEWATDITAIYMAATYQLLKKEADADKLMNDYKIGQFVDGLTGKQATDRSDYDSRLAHDAQYVYLMARHFPARFDSLEGKQLLSLVDPIFQGRYNTVSSAAAILALDAYSDRAGDTAAAESVRFAVPTAEGGEQVLDIADQPYPQATAPIDAQQIMIDGPEKLFYLASQSGYNQSMPETAISEKLEVSRQYLDAQGKPVSSAKQGDELTVRLRIRALQGTLSNVAVVDLLPGGFEVQRDSVRRKSANWLADYTDVREDRVVFYGTFGNQVTELSYKVKLTARGNFVVPPPFAEAMYDRTAVAQGLSGRFEVKAAQ
ncbi:alpha-2-macroglobulin [Thiosocius teredinicola]|uniref:alpha-2-macroglobulin n=1 Tax=Thiosocius teredinicola TaxID=1973002 RepID=UPI000990B69D